MTESFRQPDAAPADDPFYWGSRLCWVDTPEGRRLEEIPLTRDDVLDPQEGDTMVQSAAHATMIRRLAEMLDCWFRRQGLAMTVLNEVKIRWGVPGLKEPAPDVTVIPASVGTKSLASYAVGTNGPLPCLVIEVASERYAEVDFGEKVNVYDRAGVAEYLIIDLENEPLTLTGFHRGPGGRYRGSWSQPEWLSRTTGLLFSAGPGDLELNVRDEATGEPLLTTWELELAREAEARARRAAEMRAEAESSARHAAEERAAALAAELDRLRRGER